MVKEISDHALAVLSIIAVCTAVFAIWISLAPMSPYRLTGAASGFANVTINETLGISFTIDTVNFSSMNPDDTATTYGTSTPNSTSGPFNITNDGSVHINITIQDTETLFSSSSLARATHYLYNVSMEYYDYANVPPPLGNCSVGYLDGLSTGAWRAMPTSAETAICGLNYTDSSDTALVHLNITVPGDEPAGQKGAEITFISSKAD